MSKITIDGLTQSSTGCFRWQVQLLLSRSWVFACTGVKSFIFTSIKNTLSHTLYR